MYFHLVWIFIKKKILKYKYFKINSNSLTLGFIGIMN